MTVHEKDMAIANYCGMRAKCDNGNGDVCPLFIASRSGFDCFGDGLTSDEIELNYSILFPNSIPTIADSGDRTEFGSGAVRDMHEGKGRFDLLPMCVLMRLARHYEAGSKKYGDRNWEKGIPCHSFADSAMRHLVKYMDGWKDEDHLIAAIWNLCGLAWTEEKKPELMDIPARKDEDNESNTG